MTYNELAQIVEWHYPRSPEVESISVQPGPWDASVEIVVEPAHLEEDIVEWLKESGNLPVGILVEASARPRTTLSIPIGVTLIGGRPLAGKTEVLLGIAQEFADDGSTVHFVSMEETAEHLATRYRAMTGADEVPIRFGEHMLGDHAHAIQDRVEKAGRGDAVLIDSVDQIHLGTGPEWQNSRGIVQLLQVIDQEAKRKGVYVVGSVQLRGAPEGAHLHTVMPEYDRAFPVFVLRPGGPVRT